MADNVGTPVGPKSFVQAEGMQQEPRHGDGGPRGVAPVFEGVDAKGEFVFQCVGQVLHEELLHGPYHAQSVADSRQESVQVHSGLKPYHDVVHNEGKMAEEFGFHHRLPHHLVHVKVEHSRVHDVLVEHGGVVDGMNPKEPRSCLQVLVISK